MGERRSETLLGQKAAERVHTGRKWEQKSFFPVQSRAPGFHACSKTGSRVARLSSSRPRLPRKTSSFPELRAERKIKRIRRVRVYIRPEIFVRLECLLNDLRSHFLNRSQGIARRSTKVKRRPSLPLQCESFGLSSLFDDFPTGQITQSVLSRSVQTLCIETLRGTLEKKGFL